MNDTQIRDLTFRRFELQLQHEKITAEIKEINKQLITEAASRPKEHEPLEDSDGTVWTTQAAGCQARVVFPTDTLKSSIREDSQAFQKISALISEADIPAPRLFTLGAIYSPVPEFRKTVGDLMTPKSGEKLIKLCTSASSPKVLIKEAA